MRCKGARVQRSVVLGYSSVFLFCVWNIVFTVHAVCVREQAVYVREQAVYVREQKAWYTVICNLWFICYTSKFNLNVRLTETRNQSYIYRDTCNTQS